MLGGLSIVFTLVGLASSDSLALLFRLANQYFAAGRPWPKHAP